MIYHRGASLSEHALLVRHGTQTIDNSRICHCLLFGECGKQNFVQPFLRSRKLLRYTRAWTKLHNVVMTRLNLWRLWLSLWVWLFMALTWSELNYCVWFDGTVCEQPGLVCHGLQLHSVDIGVELDSKGPLIASICWLSLNFSTCANLKCTYWFVQFKFLVYGHP